MESFLKDCPTSTAIARIGVASSYQLYGRLTPLSHVWAYGNFGHPYNCTLVPNCSPSTGLGLLEETNDVISCLTVHWTPDLHAHSIPDRETRIFPCLCYIPVSLPIETADPVLPTLLITNPNALVTSAPAPLS